MDNQQKQAIVLIEAVIANDIDLVIDVLNEGIDPNNTLDDACVTALHYAAQNDRLELIPVLVEAGADIYAETEPDGLTPIEVAVMHGHHKTAQLLVSYGSASGEAH